MRVFHRLIVTALLTLTFHVGAAAQPPASQGEFVPVDQLQTQETIPAAPLVAAAYGVAWAAVLIYLLSLWRRLGRVDRELAEVTRRLDTRARP